MLHLLLTEKILDNMVIDIDTHFRTAWEPEWIDNDFAKAMIKDIDNSIVVAPRIIDSPYLGYVDPTYISGGVKCVLCMLFGNIHKWLYDITVCGENCAKWIQRAGTQRDVTVALAYMMTFDDNEPFPIHIVNDKSYVHSQKEFVSKFVEVVCAARNGLQ